MVSRAKWDPALHPRGAVGRFIPSGGSAPHAPSPGVRALQEEYEARGRRDPLWKLSDEYDQLAAVERELTDDEWAVVYKYGKNSNALNHGIRVPSEARPTMIVPDRDDPEWGEPRWAEPEELRRLMDSAVESRVLTEDTTLYRGLNLEDGGFQDLQPGDQIRDPAYLSTTVDPNTAALFGRDRLEIEVPAGTPAFPVGLVNRDFYEQLEFALGRGTVLEVLQVREDSVDRHGDPVRRIRARLVGYLD